MRKTSKIKSIKTEYIKIVTEEYEDDPDFVSRTTKTYPDGFVEVSCELTDEAKKDLTVPYDSFAKMCGESPEEMSFLEKIVNVFKKNK